MDERMSIFRTRSPTTAAPESDSKMSRLSAQLEDVKIEIVHLTTAAEYEKSKHADYEQEISNNFREVDCKFKDLDREMHQNLHVRSHAQDTSMEDESGGGRERESRGKMSVQMSVLANQLADLQKQIQMSQPRIPSVSKNVGHVKNPALPMSGMGWLRIVGSLKL